MTDDFDWNPSIVTPSGEAVAFEATEDDRPWRDAETLENAVERGLTDGEMAAKWGISEAQVRRYRLRNDITRRGNPDRDRTYDQEPTTNMAAANAGGGTAYHEPDGEVLDDLDDREAFDCPECGRDHGHAEAQHRCLRSHARDRADRLARLADEGTEVLAVRATAGGGNT